MCVTKQSTIGLIVVEDHIGACGTRKPPDANGRHAHNKVHCGAGVNYVASHLCPCTTSLSALHLITPRCR